MSRGTTRWIVLVAAVVLIAVSCGNSKDTTTSKASGSAPPGTANTGDLSTNIPSDQPGVTSTEIHIGGVVSKTNPLGGDYAQAFKGAQAYFDMINAKDGIYGRQLKLVSQRDDQVANNQAEIQGLISQDHVFAILPVATLLFSGAQTAADSGTPTFGWNINAEWGGPKNLFGERGSYTCFTCAHPITPWLAKQTGRSKVAILAYSVQQSKECADGIKASFEKYPTADVVFEDTALSYGTTDFSVQVAKMKDAGVDFVDTCMDTNGVTSLQKEIKKQQLDAIQYLPNGYDYDLVENFGDIFQGSLVLAGSTPFEVSDPPPGMQDYFHWIDEAGGERGELSLAGWLNADLLYQGLVAAGPSFTQASVTDAINQMTDWSANGIGPGINWTIAHDEAAATECSAILKIDGSAFVPQYGEPGKPFVCFDSTQPLPDEPERVAGGGGA